MNTPQAPRQWYQLRADERDTATVHIYDLIGDAFAGVDAAELVRTIDALNVDQINVQVHSPGGNTADGIAIMNALRRHPARVVATVDGIAASAASVVLLGSDEVVMGRGAEITVNDASSFASGNATAIRAQADILDTLSTSVSGLYADRAGGTPEQWRAAMLTNTHYNAAEAVTAGLADRTADTPSTDPATASTHESTTRQAATSTPRTPHQGPQTARTAPATATPTRQRRDTPKPTTQDDTEALYTRCWQPPSTPTPRPPAPTAEDPATDLYARCWHTANTP